MQSALKFLASASLAGSVFAHYNFDSLIVDGSATEPYEYVRRMTNSNSPVTDVSSTDMRCNVGTQANAASTKTKAVAAGAQVGFTVADNIGHPGPLTVYLSKAPGDVSEYDGSGEWFKIWELGTSEITSAGLQWASNGMTSFNFSLPTELADGQYLLRAEHVGLHGASTEGGAQFYISCAQIEVTGGGSGTPSPTVEIPGYLTGTEPGIVINIYYPVPTSYDMPGPAVWPATSGSGGSSPAVSSVAPVASSPAASSSVQAAVTTPVAVSPSSSYVDEEPAPTAAPAVSTPAVSAPAASSTAACTRLASSPAATFATSVRPVGTGSAPVPVPSATGDASSGAVKKYYQCGGKNYSGATTCESGLTCKQWNEYYFQCI